MGSINQVVLVGNVGQKPELRETAAKKPVANFTLATNNVFTTGQGDAKEKKEEVQWHRVVVWGPMAETVAKFVDKGSTVGVTGRLEYREWTDKEGKERFSAEIIADNVQFLSKGKGAPPAAPVTASGEAEG